MMQSFHNMTQSFGIKGSAPQITFYCTLIHPPTNMTFRGKKLKTLKEIMDALEEADEEGADDIEIVIIPPDVDSLSDEDEVDEDIIGEAIVNDIPGTLELQYYVDNISSSKKKVLTNVQPSWQKRMPIYQKLIPQKNDHVPFLEEMIEKCLLKSPVELFEVFFSSEVLDYIVKETVRYAIEQKNRGVFTVSVEEIKAFLGILLFTGYHRLPSERNYWSNEEDLGIDIVKKALSRNRYLEIKSHLHFADNSEADNCKDDKGFKVRPLFTKINNSFQQFGVMEQNLAVDEMMICYYGHHSLKQFIKGKPIRFGYKFWALCGVSGYCYKFDLYCGRIPGNPTEELTLGTKVVVSMTHGLAMKDTSCVYFDNLFTSRDLLVYLQTQGIRATGTVRENRLQNCPLRGVEQKKEKRGYYNYSFDKNGEVLVVKWNDNKCVTIATNWDSIEPVNNVLRWDKKEKAKVRVPQPNLLKNYNSYMGGVDHHDWLLGKYKTNVRGKKWYWPLFTRVLDMAVVNAWLLHKFIHKEQASDLLTFKRKIAVPYMKCNSGRKPMRCSTVSTNMDSRFDNRSHFLEKRDQQRRCQNKPCRGRPKSFCGKCGVTLCTPCFEPYHNK